MSRTHYLTYVGRNPKDPETELTYEVQLRKRGEKYRTVFKGTRRYQAYLIYHGYNLSARYGKRLLCDGVVMEKETVLNG